MVLMKVLPRVKPKVLPKDELRVRTRLILPQPNAFLLWAYLQIRYQPPPSCH